MAFAVPPKYIIEPIFRVIGQNELVIIVMSLVKY